MQKSAHTRLLRHVAFLDKPSSSIHQKFFQVGPFWLFIFYTEIQAKVVKQLLSCLFKFLNFLYLFKKIHCTMLRLCLPKFFATKFFLAQFLYYSFSLSPCPFPLPPPSSAIQAPFHNQFQHSPRNRFQTCKVSDMNTLVDSL